MSLLYNILSVARYERMMMFRSTRFRVLGALGMLIPIAIGVMLAIAEARGVEFGSALAMGAFIPFYVFSFLQTVVVAFVVGDFRAGDERAHIHEVVDASPISTAELVIGKYLGAMTALVALSVGVLITTVLIQAAKISITGLPFSLEPYLVYMMVMTLPSMVFVSALTFVLGAVLRKQTAVALTVGAYTIAVILFLGRRYDGLFDFGAFFAPLFYSDLLGTGDISEVLQQRLMYCILAVGLLGLSINRYPRLSQSASCRWIGRVMAVVGLAGSASVYAYSEHIAVRTSAFRKALSEERTRIADRRAPRVLHYHFAIELLSGRSSLSATVGMDLVNPYEERLDTLYVSLNPGLTINAVNGSNGPLPYDHDLGIVRIPSALPAGDTMRVELVYDGEIDNDAFDLVKTESRLQKSRHPFYKGDMTAWIDRRSVFLPPRSNWYPRPGVETAGSEPSYATANLTVSLPAHLTPVTQGVRADSTTSDGRKTEEWRVESGTPAFSLNAGVYRVYEKNIHGVNLALYIHPTHRRQVEFFKDAEEEAIQVIDQIIDVMEQETGLAYPFSRLSVVEVPFQIQWYFEGWQERGGLVQPGILMVEEDVLLGKRFSRDFERRQRFSRGREVEPASVKRDLLVSAILETFFSKEGGRGGLFRSPIVQLWSFDRSFTGEQSALVSRGLPLFLQQDVETTLRESSNTRSSRRGRFRGRRGRRGPDRSETAAWDTLMTEMGQRSFADLDPSAEPDLYRRALNAKGPTMFRMVESVVGDESFLSTMEAIGARSRFEDVPFEDFESAFMEGTRRQDRKETLKRLVNEWIYSTHVPGYTLTKATAVKMDDGWGAVVYQVKVRVRNGEPGRGFVQVTVTGQEDEAVRGVEIEGGTEIEIGLIIWDRPRRVSVDPFFARNRRRMMAPLSIPEQVFPGVPRSYVTQVKDDDSRLAEVIVDNEDEGFSMPVRRVTKYLRPQLKGGNWDVRELPMAYGRYETNFRWKAPGDGAQPAVWRARIPQGGEYDVAYYYPPPQMRGRLRLGKSFTIRIEHGGGLDTLTVESEHMQAGWNLLGRFTFPEQSESVVELSDDADGRLYADAVRWRYVDPDNPDVVYEEDVPAWNFGRGFGPGGGRGWGGGPGGGWRR